MTTTTVPTMATTMAAEAEDPTLAARVSAAVRAIPAGPPLIGAGIAPLRQALAEGLRAGGLPTTLQIRVDRETLERAERCPAAAASARFAWRAVLASRRLGTSAVEAMLDRPTLGAAEAATQAVEEALTEGGRLGLWLAGLSAAGRGAVIAAATTWSSRAFTAVPWVDLGAQPLHGIANGYPPGYPQVTIAGRYDAELGRGRGLAVLLLIGGMRPAAASLDALGFTLHRGFAPLGVVVLDPSRGSVTSLLVDEALLVATVQAVVRASLASGRRLEALPMEMTPGSHCRWCAWRDGCPPGRAWLDAAPRRVNGIPV